MLGSNSKLQKIMRTRGKWYFWSVLIIVPFFIASIKMYYFQMCWQEINPHNGMDNYCFFYHGPQSIILCRVINVHSPQCEFWFYGFSDSWERSSTHCQLSDRVCIEGLSCCVGRSSEDINMVLNNNAASSWSCRAYCLFLFDPKYKWQFNWGPQEPICALGLKGQKMNKHQF